MKEAIEISVRQAIPSDAKQLLSLLNQIYKESDFLTMDKTDVEISEKVEALHIESIYERNNNVLLLAFDGEKMIGMASVHADHHQRVAHIGDIGISILKEYWNSGLGTVLMTELIDWAVESKIIRRLELTVQDRNKRAIHVYEKMGFHTECIMPRGAIDANGEFLDVHLMSKMID